MTLQGLSGKKAVFFIEARLVLTLGLFLASRVVSRWSLVVSNKEVTFIWAFHKLGLFCIIKLVIVSIAFHIPDSGF